MISFAALICNCNGKIEASMRDFKSQITHLETGKNHRRETRISLGLSQQQQ
jgi:hypothetical protein